MIASSRNIKVLVVDDSALVRQVVGTILSQEDISRSRLPQTR